jgi:hypothetical protein
MRQPDQVSGFHSVELAASDEFYLALICYATQQIGCTLSGTDTASF